MWGWFKWLTAKRDSFGAVSERREIDDLRSSAALKALRNAPITSPDILQYVQAADVNRWFAEWEQET